MTEQPPIRTSNMEVPLSPAQPSRFWMRLLLIGGGGCLMLVVLMLLGFAGSMAALGGSGDETGEGPQTNPTAKMGAPLRVGEVIWIVQDAKRVTELTTSYEGYPPHHKHDATSRTSELTSENSVNAKFAELPSVLKKSALSGSDHK